MMKIIRVAIFRNYFQEGGIEQSATTGHLLQCLLLESVLVMARGPDFTHAAVDTCAFLTYTSSKDEMKAT